MLPRVAILLTILTVCLLPAVAGPISPYYLAGYLDPPGCCASNWIEVVQGNNVIHSWEVHGDALFHAYDEPLIAVTDFVRTTGGFHGRVGYEYTTDGTWIDGPTYTNTASDISGYGLRDGATDGTTNYSALYSEGEIYTFDTDWANPHSHALADPEDPDWDLNVNAEITSVAYDWQHPGHVWVLSEGGKLWYYDTSTWTASSAPITLSPYDGQGGFSNAEGLAMDSDGSLWFMDDLAGRSGYLYRYDLSNADLSSTYIAALHTSGFVATGGDIFTGGRGGAGDGSGVPEPGTLGVMGLALLAMSGIRRR